MWTSLIKPTAILSLMLSSSAVWASDWALNADQSALTFGSIKKDTVGEVHSFETLTGTVSDTGAVEITISLPSVETYIDIRNERMNEHVFKGAEAAKLTASVDIAAMNALAVGDLLATDVTASLSFLGRDIPVDAELIVARLSEKKVMISTANMIFLSVEDAGVTEGVDMLQTLAKLSGITRTVPVTARFVFETDGETAGVVTEAPVAVAALGDAERGKKVFKKCKACHVLEEGKNRVGPSLHNIVGKAAGSVDGFRYSKSLKEAGLTWTEEALDAFLTKPRNYLPGNKMSFPGLKKEKDRQDLIAYLRDAS